MSRLYFASDILEATIGQRCGFSVECLVASRQCLLPAQLVGGSCLLVALSVSADALLPALTGAEHVCLYGCLLGLAGSQLPRFCDEFFDIIGCKKYMHRLVKSYSGGTKRKLSLGLAMLGNVDLLLLDEPTNGVDPESRQVLWRMIEDAKNCQIAGKAIILTSHSMEECEVLSDRVGIIRKGKMLCLGTPAELRSTYGHGYQIECVFVAASVALDPSLPRLFVSALQRKLPTLRVLHRMAYKVTASVAKGEASLATIFCEIEEAKARCTPSAIPVMVPLMRASS